MHLKISPSFQFLGTFILILSSCSNSGNNKQSGIINDQISEFNMPGVKEPEIPDNTVTITDFGAKNDGQILNTRAFQDAIENLSVKGGGKLVIPRGIWLTGPIVLKNNINLCTEEGAIVLFSADKSLYPLISTNFEGENTVRCTSPISGMNLTNIAFTGKGIWDGNGDVWRPVKKDKLTEQQWNKLVRSGGVLSEDGKTWFPSESYIKGQQKSEMNVPSGLKDISEYNDIKDFLRPVMVSLVHCKQVLMDGPTFQNSPAWCLHPLMCEDIIIRNITVRNPWYSQNGDGLDVESSKNCLLYNCSFDVGDDAICIKSGKNKEGRQRGIPTENMIIRNCTVYHGHGGITIGSEMSGGVRNIYASGCTFLGTDVGLRFKSTRGRGGIVENIFIDGINMMNIPTQAISFNLYYGGTSPTEMEETTNNSHNGEILSVTEETPLFRNISIKNVTCKGAAQALFLQGLPEQNLQNFFLENIDIEADKGLACIDCRGVKINNLRLLTRSSDVVKILNSSNIEIQKLIAPSNSGDHIYINGKRSSEINIKTGKLINTVIGREVDSSTIKILQN